MIFCLSSQDATVSSQTSGSLIRTIAGIILPDFSKLSAPEQAEIIASLQFIVRKVAHFSLYAALGVFAFCSVISYRTLRFPTRVLSGALICLLYAVSDEIHQRFVPGRSCELRDVCIDFCGSLLAIVLCALLARFCRRIYRHIATEK